MNDNLALDDEKTFSEEIIDLARGEHGIEFDKSEEDVKLEASNSFFLQSNSKELCDVLWISSTPTYAPGSGVHANLYKHTGGNNFNSVIGVMNIKDITSCTNIFSYISKQINA